MRPIALGGLALFVAAAAAVYAYTDNQRAARAAYLENCLELETQYLDRLQGRSDSASARTSEAELRFRLQQCVRRDVTLQQLKAGDLFPAGSRQR